MFERSEGLIGIYKVADQTRVVSLQCDKEIDEEDL